MVRGTVRDTTALPVSAQRWVLAALGLVILPHLPHLPWWLSLYVIGVALVKLRQLHRPARQPSRAVLAVLTLAGIGGVLLHFGTLLGRNAGVALMVVMLVLKLLEMRATRDALLVLFLCYFVVITNFLFTQTPLIALYMLLVAVVITAGLSVTAHAGAARSGRSHLRLAATLLVQAMPIMAVVFVFFPRVVGPLWGLPEDAHAGITGLGDSMSPGAISSLARSEEEAFRVAFTGLAPAAAQRYWRGPVFWHTDGRTWSSEGVNNHGIPLGTRPRGEAVHYAVTLEPHGKRWLFGLDLPVKVSVPAWVTLDYQWTRRKPVNERLYYEATSWPEYRSGALVPRLRTAGLQLPANVTARMRALANGWREQAASDRDIVRLALAYFNTEPFVYTLVPPLLERNPMDEFLFETRRGFCEHYSAAFVILMRLAGLPARVVTGYQGGEYNPVGDYWLVRQSDAHAWAEVWLADGGWERVDPTAAVAPERIEYGLDTENLAVGTAARFRLSDKDLLANLRYTLDALTNYWNFRVLAYGPTRQQELLGALGFERPSWRDMALVLLLSVSALLLGIAAWMFLRRPGPEDPVQRAWQRYCRRLARLGLPRRPAEGPHDYASRVRARRPDLARPVGRITELYILLRYGRPADPATGRLLLRKLVRRFVHGAH
jgi:transglutaminase-like putative cysteine protease